MLSISRLYEHSGETPAALDCLDRAIALEGKFFPAVIEKAKVHFSANCFDKAREAAERSVTMSGGNLEALCILALSNLLSLGDISQTESVLKILVPQMLETESSNAYLQAKTSQLFARLSRQSKDILHFSVRLMAHACDIDASCSSYYAELGFQRCLLGAYSDASKDFQHAIELDEANISALYGSIRVQILTGNLDDAEQQIEFLSLVQDNKQSHPEMLFVKALLAKHRGDSKNHILLLKKATRSQLEIEKPIVGNPNQTCFFYNTSPQLDILVDVVDAAREILAQQDCSIPLYPECGKKYDTVSSKNNNIDDFILLLRHVTVIYPAFIESWLSLAKAYIEYGRFSEGKETMTKCISLNPRFGLSYLLMAQLLISQKDMCGAKKHLEEALSNNFTLQTHPLYLLSKGELLMEKGDFEEATDSLQQAIASCDNLKTDFTMTLSDRLWCFINLSLAFSEMKCFKKSCEVLKDALGLFSGKTFAQLRIQTQMYLQSKKIDKALKVLECVPAESPAYLSAHMAKANILLHICHNKESFVKCFQDLANKNNNSDSFMRLGDAYIQIQAPGVAVTTYERAHQLNPDNEVLVMKIGTALIGMHQFKRAQDYYEQAHFSMPQNWLICKILSSLYSRLGQHDKAAAVLLQIKGDTEQTLESVLGLLDVATALREKGEFNNAENIINEAKNIQKELAIQDCTEHKRNSFHVMKANVMRKLGKLSEYKSDLSFSEEMYFKVLKLKNKDEDSMLSLAYIYLRKGKVDGSFTDKRGH